MFKVTYKAGWSHSYVTLGIYETRADAIASIRANLKGSKPKVWNIKIEPCGRPILRNARMDESHNGTLEIELR